MFIQLGNMIFERLITPSSYSVDGDEAIYAEHALLNGRPRLQKTGDSLQTIALEVRMRPEFCKPSERLKDLKSAKDAGTVLPLLMGNGKYLADYVIINMPYTIEQALADGTPVEILMTLNLKEHVTYDRIAQKKSGAKQKALAIGTKSPVVLRPYQVEDPFKSISRSITQATLQTRSIDTMVNDYENSPSARPLLAARIKAACDKTEKSIESMNGQIDKLAAGQNKVELIATAGKNLVSFTKAMKNGFPYSSAGSLKTANGTLQNALGSLKNVSAPLFSSVITRGNLAN